MKRVLLYVQYFSKCLDVLAKGLSLVASDWPDWPSGNTEG